MSSHLKHSAEAEVAAPNMPRSNNRTRTTRRVAVPRIDSSPFHAHRGRSGLLIPSNRCPVAAQSERLRSSNRRTAPETVRLSPSDLGPVEDTACLAGRVRQAERGASKATVPGAGSSASATRERESVCVCARRRQAHISSQRSELQQQSSDHDAKRILTPGERSQTLCITVRSCQCHRT